MTPTLRNFTALRFLLAALIFCVPTAFVHGYSESTYYSQPYYQPYYQATYYSQPTYYSQATYYSQPTYYSQATYYAESTYYSQPAYYSQPYYQGYYEGTYYSQPYYQPYYQPTYQLVFTKNAAASKNVTIGGSLSKSSGTFVIDHPLDPKNKLLYHSFVESPDVKDIYDGNAILDSKGEVVIVLPDYFEALNGNFRYLTRPLGASMPNLYIKSEVKNNQFSIGGGVPGRRVSWQVTGIRHDPYILAHPVVVEVEKSKDTIVGKGSYIYPPGFTSSQNGFFGSITSLLSSFFH